MAEMSRGCLVREVLAMALLLQRVVYQLAQEAVLSREWWLEFARRQQKVEPRLDK
jgi:hypothetical protein